MKCKTKTKPHRVLDFDNGIMYTHACSIHYYLHIFDTIIILHTVAIIDNVEIL